MKVKVIRATEKPIEVISVAAATSVGKNGLENVQRRVKNCFNMGHTSVFEHASFTVEISGISRSCSHQLVRHRLASFIEKSQRYCKIDTKEDWYVCPPSFSKSEREWFDQGMQKCASLYNIAIAGGIKPEDARYFLPEATKTDIVMTMNAREFFHFLDLRIDKKAQWEIRTLAHEIYGKLYMHSYEWALLLDIWDQREVVE